MHKFKQPREALKNETFVKLRLIPPSPNVTKNKMYFWLLAPVGALEEVIWVMALKESLQHSNE